MKRSFEKQVASFMIVTLVAMTSSSLICHASWDACPDPDLAGVWKEHDQQWFHISQTCGLEVVGEDEDSYNGVPDGGDHLDGEECYWTGEFILSTEGLVNTWVPRHYTLYGDSVTVCVDDDPDYPDGVNTDDGSVTSSSFKLYAWEVVVSATGSSTVDSSSETKVVSESGWDTTITSSSINCTLAKGSVTAQTTDTGTCFTTCDVADDGPTQFGAAQADGLWEFGKMPTGAATGTATGKCTVGASMSGSISAVTDDDDFDILGDTVSVGISASASGWGVRISTTITLTELCEAGAGIGFGFNSDILSSCFSDTYKIEITSGDSPNDDTVNYSHNPSGQTFTGSLTAKKNAQAMIDGKVEAKGYRKILELYGNPYACVHYNSSASISSTGSCTYTCSGVDAENLSTLNPNGVLLEVF